MLERQARLAGDFLDKTGTLTEPGLNIVAWHGDESIRSQVAALEAQVSHPIARAIAADADLNRAETLPGALRGSSTTAENRDQPLEVILSQSCQRGIAGTVDGKRFMIGSEPFVCEGKAGLAPRASVDASALVDAPLIAPDWAIAARREMTTKCLTPVWVAVDERVAAVIGVGSRLRDDAAKTIQDLQQMGLKVVILSGDDPDTVNKLGKQLGILPEDCRGGLSPEDKLRIVEAGASARPTLMVGDGVNDAAALSAASVGIAVHGGAEASLAAADVYLGRPGVSVFIELLEGAGRTLKVIHRCLGVSLGYNLVAAALAMAGVINPLIAAILMPLASFTVLGIAMGSRTFVVVKGSVR